LLQKLKEKAVPLNVGWYGKKWKVQALRELWVGPQVEEARSVGIVELRLFCILAGLFSRKE
jgi:hypothetical protein